MLKPPWERGSCTWPRSSGTMATMTKAEIATLRDDLAAMLSAIDGGELAASHAMRHRLEGAVTALNAALGQVDAVLAPWPERE